MTATTIPKNSRRIAQLKADLTRCRVYSLSNDFTGRDCGPEHAWAALADAGLRAKLRDDGNGTYTVTVHSNLWFKLTAAQPAPGTKPEPRGTADLEDRAIALLRLAAAAPTPVDAGLPAQAARVVRDAHTRGKHEAAAEIAAAYSLFIDDDNLDLLRDTIDGLLPPGWTPPEDTPA